MKYIFYKLCLSLLKPLHAGWMIDLNNHMTGEKAKKVIDSGWTSLGIKGAILLGLNTLPSIDPFDDIAPMMAEPVECPVIHNVAICNLTPEVKSIEYSRDDGEDGEESDNEDVWGPPGDNRNIFDIINDFDDEKFLAFNFLVFC